MPAPFNPFKAAIAAHRPQVGLWLALASETTAEICAGAGFDWLLIDAEHAPNDIPVILAQLRAVAASPAHPVVRVPVGETWLIKQVLDLGAQTLLVPMVETRAQAEALVRAMRYPPGGVRGVGAALARASAYNRIPDYLATANDQACLLVQIESRAGLAALDEIASVEGVDGVFIGPADLAADMGHLGQPGHPQVQEEVQAAILRLRSHGKAAGILTADQRLARRYLDLGASFVAVGHDVGLIANGAAALAAAFKSDTGVLAGAGYADAVVQSFGATTDVVVRMQGDDPELGNKVAAALRQAGEQLEVKKVEFVGPQVGEELRDQGGLGLLLALGGVMLYLAFRFQWKFGVGAIISLIHDVIVTLGILSFFQITFDLTVMAALLAIIGYSLNDTIVVFDRIRENFRKLRRADPVEIVDISLTETLRRTIMTVLTVAVVVLAMLLVGGPALQWFSVALLVGLFAGTYSSIYVGTAYALAMGLSRDDFIIQVKKAEDELP